MRRLNINTPFEVTAAQYAIIMGRHAGSCAGRSDGDKYFIMLWHPGYRKEVENIIFK